MGSIVRRLLPGRLRRSYAAKFFVGLLLVTVVAGGVGGYIYVNAGDQLQDATADELTTTASLQRDQIDEWYRGTTSNMQSLRVSVSTMLGQPGTSGNTIQNALSATVERREHVEAAYYGDLSNGELEIATGDQRFMNQSGAGAGRIREPIRETAATSLNESGSAVGSTEPFQLAGDDDPYMVFATNIDGKRNQTILLVANVASVGKDYLLEQESGSVVLVDANGRRLASTEENDTALDSTNANGFDPSEGATRNGDTGFTSRSEVDGRTVAVGSAVGEAVPWTVATRVPTSDAYALQRAISNQVLVLVALVFASLGLLGVTLGRNTVRSVRELSASAERLRDGNLEADVPTARADEIGELGRAFDDMRESLRDRVQEVESARSDAEAARQSAEAMQRHLERKADAYEETMNEVADGDLTARLDSDSRSDAMRSVAEACNRMLDDIADTVASATAFANAVEQSSESAATSTGEVERASAQVTESVQEISVGADRQHDNLQSVNAEMESLSTSTEEIAATTNDVADLSERTAEVGRSGQAAAEAAIEGMEQVEDESADAVDAIESLEGEMAAVDELVEFISDVANQTNMLALNANIEASRGGGAGDGSGDGFAVVAQEVKELAQETQDAASDVEERLERIREETDRTAAEVRATKEQVAANAEDVREAAEALSTVAGHVERTNEGVQEISAATEEQAASTEEVVAMVEEATTISEETSAEAETVAAAAEEQTANLSDVSERVESLASQARALSEHLATFEVHESDGRADDDGDDDGDRTAGAPSTAPSAGGSTDGFASSSEE
jgi:methyl-accepting chemotaxis protein